MTSPTGAGAASIQERAQFETLIADTSARLVAETRLNVFPIVVPPLRDRREDIPQLVELLVREVGESMRKHFQGVDPESLRALAEYDWPGYVRELRNVLERAMILSSGRTLTVEPPRPSARTLSQELAAPVARSGGDGGLRALERDHILRVLGQTGGRIRGKGAAAEILGLKPTTLEARMQRLGIRRPVASDSP